MMTEIKKNVMSDTSFQIERVQLEHSTIDGNRPMAHGCKFQGTLRIKKIPQAWGQVGSWVHKSHAKGSRITVDSDISTTVKDNRGMSFKI